ncbi:MAG: ATP-binding protein [Calditrichaeota bacterium]|nr:ATP-binding protein [Calditrichota bacterium]
MEKLRYYLQWWFEYHLPNFVPRDFPMDLFDVNLIPVLVGPRRSGKSTLFFQLISKLRERIPAKNIIYVNYEDDRLLPLDGRELSELLNTYRQTYKPSPDHFVYLFLDEIQNVPGWEKIIRRIHETEPRVKLFLTGSNSKMLSREIATSLRGRTLPQQVYPISFREYLRFIQIEIPEIQTLKFSTHKDQILNAFEDYLRYGGFPEVVLTSKTFIKEEILKQYMNTIFFKDIVERYSIRNYKALDIFIKILSRQMASLVSYGKLQNSLKSIGIGISKNTIIDYFSYVEDAMLGKGVAIFSYSVKDQLQYPRKFYLVDNGLYRTVAFLKEGDNGRLLENLVYGMLERKFNEIFYWKDKNGREVDFVLPRLFDNSEAFPLIQVCYSFVDNSVRKREITAILKACKEFKVDKALIITRDQWEDFETEGIKIKVLPFIEWSLALNELRDA